MDKPIWYIHTMEYHSALEREEIMIHMITGMVLENIMLNERANHKRITVV